MDEESLEESMQQAWKSSQLSANNSAYLDGLYEDYLNDPESVEQSWRNYFNQLTANQVQADRAHSPIRAAFAELAFLPKLGAPSNSDRRLIKVMELINAYRTLGHRRAKIDPLSLIEPPPTPELDLNFYDLSDADLSHDFDIDGALGLNQASLKTILDKLTTIYCQSIGSEYMHISDSKEKLWLQQQLEAKQPAVAKEKKQWILQRLLAADGIEQYLNQQFAGQKRFSLEGGDALIPMINETMKRACAGGVKEIVIGMGHRGRLNVLVNIVGKSPEELFQEFKGVHDKDFMAGDVKYHMGFSSDIQVNGNSIHLALAFNPSHLEIVSPVVEGSVRARQARRDSNRDAVLPIQIHGDAAFAAQGVVMETFAMSLTPGFCTGGSIHIIINNQVGFTTSDPHEARSSLYCTDIAKMIEAPILHVNSDDAEAVLRVTQMAIDYRMKFNKDVVIDLVCYRRHGHQEVDEPMATQPLMYQIIKKRPVAAAIYAKQLIDEDCISKSEVDQLTNNYRQALEKGSAVVKLINHDRNSKYVVDWAPYMGCPWDIAYSTALPKSELIALAKKLDKLPPGFTPQRQVGKTLDDRVKMTNGQKPVNWGYAEILAYATLLQSNYPVRISGEDSQRGTFAHRHAVLHDQKTGETYTPLAHIAKKQAYFTLINSLLSEEGVLAFEYGYSSSSPERLVIWEAQYGDFANTAQVVIDQFISSADEKWGRLCGLVLYLPHGQEGAGAEHSSARLERYLQLCAHDNMQVCVPSTPAQIYHMIRRQMLRPFRKPLIVMTPKSLLRHPLVISSLDELAKGHFQLVIDDPAKLSKSKVTRVVLCCGKVYYDLVAKRDEHKIKDIALIRIEQLYPYPEQEIKQVLAQYKNGKDIVWTQEEPINQGAWRNIRAKLWHLLPKDGKLSHVGREAFAAPAVGYPSLYKQQQQELVNTALKLS